jgi:epsilon-lactone hydrolase
MVRAPSASAQKVILYFHGGGYVIGSINSHRHLVSELSRASGMSALLLGYRLAPEAPFPAALEDACAAYRWLLVEGIRPEKIMLGGDSADCGLAIATLVALRDAGEALPAAAICISPWTDLEAIGESYTTRAANDPMCHRPGILRLAEICLAGRNPRTPLASSLYGDLRRLPPLTIHVG